MRPPSVQVPPRNGWLGSSRWGSRHRETRSTIRCAFQSRPTGRLERRTHRRRPQFPRLALDRSSRDRDGRELPCRRSCRHTRRSCRSARRRNGCHLHRPTIRPHSGTSPSSVPARLDESAPQTSTSAGRRLRRQPWSMPLAATTSHVAWLWQARHARPRSRTRRSRGELPLPNRAGVSDLSPCSGAEVDESSLVSSRAENPNQVRAR